MINLDKSLLKNANSTWHSALGFDLLISLEKL